jgi:ribonuclease P protein component
MLAKKHRLPIAESLTKKGRAVRMPGFTVRILPSSLPFSRFGVVLGRRVAKTAVLRNKARRRAYEALRARMSQLPAADYLIVANPRSSGYGVQQWYDEFIPSSITGSAY